MQAAAALVLICQSSKLCFLIAVRFGFASSPIPRGAYIIYMHFKQVFILGILTLAFMAAVYGLLRAVDHHSDLFMLVVLTISATILLVLIVWTFFHYMRRGQGDHFRLDD